MQVCGNLKVNISRVKGIHFLLQVFSISVFTWHWDDKDLGLTKDMVTAIVPLNSKPSGMQIHGFKPYPFGDQGSMVAFSGAALHRSIKSPGTLEDTRKNIWERSEAELRSGPVKVVYFLDT